MVTAADWLLWKKADFLPYVHHIVQVFGEDRLLYGSDWPVCLLATGAGYSKVHDTLHEVLPENLDKEAHNKIFGLNAQRFYRLTVS